MRNPLQAAPFLRAYGVLPHRALNRTAGILSRVARPRWAIDAAIRAWIELEDIELHDVEAREFSSIDDFFLRRLRPGARPIGDGVVSPVDGRVVAAGDIDQDTTLLVKGERLSVARILFGASREADTTDLRGGRYVVVFLSPRGYHRVHAPLAGTLRAVRWIPGRYFPQNERALRLIPRVYERNERATLSIDAGDFAYALVMVGASLVGGIHLEAMPRRRFARDGVTSVAHPHAKGDELGHFAFGSTVVVVLPPCPGELRVAIGDDVRMGQTLIV